uniref:Uncharacterized protein n=1 Tax=Romanomermis culicivorax TaxID=13658 RepID=A0A915J624_ROMCU
MASILSWTPQSSNVVVDSLVKLYFSNHWMTLKFFHIMFDTTKTQWEMKTHFFFTSERTKLENLVHELEFATLAQLNARMMHWNVDEAWKFVEKALETSVIIRFHNNENIITVEHALESIKVYSLMAESNSMLTNYAIQEFDPLIIDLKQEDFNSIFTNMEEVSQNILIKNLNEKILLISDMLYDKSIRTQYYMDILHGIVSNFMEEYSIRTDRLNISDIVLGTSDAPLEPSTSPQYLRCDPIDQLERRAKGPGACLLTASSGRDSLSFLEDYEGSV